MADKRFCYCVPLKRGAIYSANFTSVISAIVCAVAASIFFRSTGQNEGHSKLAAFSVICYALIYVFASRKVVRGVKYDEREKLFVWLAMTLISVAFLVSGAIFVLASYGTGLKFEEFVSHSTGIGLSVLCLILACLLVYCFWIVAVMYRHMGRDVNEQTEANRTAL